MTRRCAFALLLISVCTLLLTIAVASEARIEKPAREAIAAGNVAFEAAIAKGDGVALGRLYTERAQALPPSSGTVEGRNAISAFWQQVIDSGVKKAKLETVEIDDQGNVAIEVGRYTLLGESGNPIDSGKYVVVWRKEGAAWRLHRDIWNSSMPAK